MIGRACWAIKGPTTWQAAEGCEKGQNGIVDVIRMRTYPQKPLATVLLSVLLLPLLILLRNSHGRSEAFKGVPSVLLRCGKHLRCGAQLRLGFVIQKRLTQTSGSATDCAGRGGGDRGGSGARGAKEISFSLFAENESGNDDGHNGNCTGHPEEPHALLRLVAV